MGNLFFVNEKTEISVRTSFLTVFGEKFKYHHKTKQADNRLNARTIEELVSIFSVEEQDAGNLPT